MINLLYWILHATKTSQIIYCQLKFLHFRCVAFFWLSECKWKNSCFVRPLTLDLWPLWQYKGSWTVIFYWHYLSYILFSRLFRAPCQRLSLSCAEINDLRILMLICVLVCMYFFLIWFIEHAPLQSSNTTCFLVIFVVGDAVTGTINVFPLHLHLH